MRVSGWAVLVRVLIALALGGGLLWWAILLWGAEHHWLFAALQYAPFWGWLLPVGAVNVLALTQPWRWRLVALAALLVVLGPVMGLVVSKGDEGAGRVRLMTYNVKAFLNIQQTGGLGRLAWEVNQHDPDVVVMQDAGEAGATRRPLSDAARKLIGDRDFYAYGQFIVASRLPMRDCAPAFVSYFNETHTYVHCVITAYGKDIDLYTVHLLSPREGLNALRAKSLAGSTNWKKSFQARLIQAGTLRDQLLARKTQRPVIMAGDFNAPERSMVVQTLLGAGLRDAYSAAGLGYGYTHGHSLRPGWSINRIDHILVSDDLGVAHCDVGGKEASEHRPVIADLLVHRD